MSSNGVIPETSIDARRRELSAALDKGIVDGIGVGAALGIRHEVLAVGHTVWTLTPSPAAANAMMIVHGGVITTLMDTAMGSAVYTRIPDGAFYTTLELKVNFIRSVQLTDEKITCDARTVHVGRRTATAECTVTSASGALVAHGSCTCMIFPPQQ